MVIAPSFLSRACRLAFSAFPWRGASRAPATSLRSTTHSTLQPCVTTAPGVPTQRPKDHHQDRRKTLVRPKSDQQGRRSYGASIKQGSIHAFVAGGGSIERVQAAFEDFRVRHCKARSP